MKHTSIKMDTPCEFINITPLNPLISKCEIKVCYVGDTPNRNRSIITKEAAKKIANSLPGSPIVGTFNEGAQDFEEHNKIVKIVGGKLDFSTDTKPYGFVDLNAKVWFQKFVDDGSIEREYLMTEGYIWTGQYPETQRIVNKGNNQSMQLSNDPTLLDAHWTKNENGEPQFFIINEAVIQNLCILGEDYEPCFEGTTITAPKIQFSLDDDFKNQMFSFMTEIKELIKEGGNDSMSTEEMKTSVAEETAPVVEEPVAEFAKEDEEKKGEEKVCPKCGKPVDECTCEDEKKPEEKEDEDKKTKYVLDEIPEYVELQTNFSNLEAEMATLKEEKSTLETQLAELVEFKKSMERKEKEDMIKNFYMLSDEDKKEVVDNIDSYSIDEIEAKLSIICVRNKVNFNLDEDNTKTAEPTTYSLNGDADVDEGTPAWIKAVQAVAKEI